MLLIQRPQRNQPDRPSPLSQEYGTTSALLISGSPNHPVDASPAGYWTVEAPTTTGGIRTAQAGRMIPFHPFDSTEGLYRIYQQPGVTPNSSDFTVLAVVHATDGVATNNLHFGRGGSSSDDSVRVYYTNANTIRFAWIDSTPSQHNLDLAVGTYFQNQIIRVAITKRGTTRGLYVIDGNGTRYIGTQTSGGATARSGTRGWFLGFRLNAGDGGVGRQGIAHFSTHNRAMDAGEAFDLLLSPGKVFAPRRIWIPGGVVGGGATNLTVADATHAHTADAQTITVQVSLVVAEASHGHTADNLTLTTVGQVTLTVDDAAHAHAADAPVLSSETLLAIADALHDHGVDNVVLSLAGSDTLVIQRAVHGHAADAPEFTLQVSLTVADATHGHSAANVLFGDALTLIYKILTNRQELNPTTGVFTIYDADGVSVLFQSNAWADAAGTIPYSGGALMRIDKLQ